MRSITGLALAALVAIGGLAANPVPVVAGTEIVTADEAPTAENERRRFMLRNTRSEVVTDEDFLGSYLLVYFGYTFCPDVCPTSLFAISEVMAGLGKDADQVTPIFISVDPDRDTPEVLAEYVSAFDDRIVALTGPKPFIDAAIGAYNGYYKMVSGSGVADYSVDHTASVAFVGPNGLLITRIGYGQSVESMIERIKAEIAAHPPVN